MHPKSVSPCVSVYFVIIREEVLFAWKEKKTFDATYKNLLELFLKADHKECADTICTVLNRRGNYILVHTSPFIC